MDNVLQFLFRGRLYSCDFFIDAMEDPIFIFCILKDNDLLVEFSDDVTIKTDGSVVLPTKNSYPELIELRQAIFSAVKNTAAFQIKIKSVVRNTSA